MRKTVLLTGLAFGMLSCGSSDQKSTENLAETPKEKLKTYDCLNDFESNYNLLLTKEEMNEVYPIDFENAKEELNPGGYGSYVYTWASDRPSFPIEISGFKMDVPDQNTIGIKMLSFKSKDISLDNAIEIFDMGYKDLSEKELEQINENLSKQDDEIKETGQEMMAVRAKSSWEAVPNLGSSAWYKWDEKYGGELVVLAGRASFTIVIKISQNTEENKKLAVELAQKVLMKCN